MSREMQESMSSAVLYHYPCPDGAFAALAAHLYFSARQKPVVFFPNTVYNPIRTEDLPLENFDAIYLLDYVGPDGFVSELSSKVKRLIILDHHKTAMERLQANKYDGKNIVKVIDMNHSGATISYDFFAKILLSENMCSGTVTTQENCQRNSLVPETDMERVGQLFKYVEDADLWRWNLPDSKAFSSGLNDMQIEFSFTKNQKLFEQLLALDPRNIIEAGRASLMLKQKTIDEALEQSYELNLGNGKFGKCLATEVGQTISHLRSELGHQLALKSFVLNLRPIGAVVYNVEELDKEDILKISLRSISSEDTTEISQVYGGGGHKNASSFMINREEFEKWKL
ncbi:uncharacterized protein LOC131027153 isoform X2 [Cryptomeria japonica]|uniref:uncharacterized protein LOC131027153 isoform X2 n=1 Tax=Cryptomeria japonica TaxID=3369 RepID=UPI0025ABFE5D|nr:uncharacterized protein LOC131027153 isoform X2 [Cryptomeria japonica]